MLVFIRTLAIVTVLFGVPTVVLAQDNMLMLADAQGLQTNKAQSDLRRAIKSWHRCFQNALNAKTKNNKCRGHFRSYIAKAKSIARKNPSANIEIILFQILRESITQTNEDKNYFLSKLKEENDIAKAFSEYLEELTNVANNLSKDKDRNHTTKIQRLVEAERRLTVGSMQTFCTKIGIMRCPQK